MFRSHYTHMFLKLFLFQECAFEYIQETKCSVHCLKRLAKLLLKMMLVIKSL